MKFRPEGDELPEPGGDECHDPVTHVSSGELNLEEPYRYIRRIRLTASIVVLFGIMPFTCSTMHAPIWASTNIESINQWYEVTEKMGLFVLLLGPPLLFLSYLRPRWFSNSFSRRLVTTLQWILLAMFFMKIEEPWQPGTIRGWDYIDMVVIEHPLFATCFYCSTLLSGLLLISFRRTRFWILRALVEFLPYAAMCAGMVYLDVVEQPEFVWG